MDKQKKFGVVIFIGFVTGILFVNIFARDYLKMTGIFSEYYLKKFALEDIHLLECLPRVSLVRILPLIGVILLARTRINRIGAVVFCGWIGFLFGMYMALGIIQLRIAGVLFCILSMFPQILLYIPAYLIGIVYTYRYPHARFGMEKRVVVALCMLVGIILECQINVSVIKWYINMM